MAGRRIIGAFDIGNPSQGQFVSIEWDPDPDVLETSIMAMADNFENWAVPMEEAREAIIEDTRLHFQAEREPIGAHWVPLDPDYAVEKEKEYPGEKILHATGALEESATSEDAWFVTEDNIMFNVDALPTDEQGRNIGAIHQAGSGKGVTAFHRINRNISGFTTNEQGQKVIELFGRRAITEPEEKFFSGFSSPEGAGHNLPARPFIGMSLQAIEAVEAVFLRHLDKTVIDEWDEPLPGGGGMVGEMGSNILGEFPVIGRTKHGVPILRTSHGPRFGRK